MKCILALLASAATASARSYLAEMADSYIRRGVIGGFRYDEATLYKGLEALIEVNGNETIKEWYKNQIDNRVLNPDGTIQKWNYEIYSLDDYRVSNSFMYWHQETGDEKYLVAADIIHQQLTARQPRNPEGGFWHRTPDPEFANQMWLDGIFMADSGYSLYVNLFQGDNTTAWDDIALQYDLIEKHCRDAPTGLLLHGYDSKKEAVWANPITGASPLVWNRAIGWYFMSLLESMSLWQGSDQAYGRLQEYFVRLAEALKKTYEDNGGWYLILSEPYLDADGNYLESSAWAMYVHGFLRGIRDGIISEEEYGDFATSAYEELIDRFVTENDDGTLNFIETVEVGSLESDASYEYYISVPRIINDNRAGGAFLLAASEYERRQK